MTLLGSLIGDVKPLGKKQVREGESQIKDFKNSTLYLVLVRTVLGVYRTKSWDI